MGSSLAKVSKQMQIPHTHTACLACWWRGVRVQGVNPTFVREIKLLREINHPHVIRLRDVYATRKGKQIGMVSARFSLVSGLHPTSGMQYLRCSCVCNSPCSEQQASGRKTGAWCATLCLRPVTPS